MALDSPWAARCGNHPENWHLYTSAVDISPCEPLVPALPPRGAGVSAQTEGAFIRACLLVKILLDVRPNPTARI